MPVSFPSDPTVVFMTAILADLESGQIKIPKFQRPFVWEWERIRDLLSSIYEGLPVGALMSWIPKEAKVSFYDALGPFQLASLANSTSSRYLMDGVQRMTTLYGVLIGTNTSRKAALKPSPEHMDTIENTTVYCDLDAIDDANRFVRKIDLQESDLSDVSRYIPMNIILESRELIRFQRSVPEGKEHRIDAADALASAFKSYKIPLIVLEADDLDLVTKSFQRINSSGVAMGELHMLNALSYTEGFHLLDAIEELRTAILAPVGWDTVDSDMILLTIKRHLGFDPYKQNSDQVSRAIRENKSELDVIFGAFVKAAKFFAEEFGIQDASQLPYKMQTVGVCGAFAHFESGELKDQLRDWIWLTTYTETFGTTARNTQIAMEDLDGFLKTGRFHWSLKHSPKVRGPGRLSNYRSARTKALGLALAKKLDGIDFPSAAASILSQKGGSALFSVAPHVDYRAQGAFRFLIDPKTSAEFTEKLLSNDFDEHFLAPHFVDETMHHMFRTLNFSDFAALREAEIFAFERDNIILPASRRINLAVAFEAI